MVAQLVLEQRRAVAITCSHASSMGLLPLAAQQRLAERLARLQVEVVALPIKTATALVSAKARAGSGPHVSQIENVSSDAVTTVGTNQDTTLSVRDSIGA